jgi:hypothetical protein
MPLSFASNELTTVSRNPTSGHFVIGLTKQNLNNLPHILAHLQGTHNPDTEANLAKEPKFSQRTNNSSQLVTLILLG